MGAYLHMGQDSKGTRLWEKTLSFQRRILSPDHMDLAQTMNNMAPAYYLHGKHQKAISLIEEAIGIWSIHLPPNHPRIQGAEQALMHMRNPDRKSRPRSRLAQAPKISVRVKPNAKCPCGSGKKYKKCCGKVK